MGIFAAFAESWRLGLRLIRLWPLIALVPVVVEIVQHGVEVQGGFYRSIAAMKAAEHDPLRMAIGHAKVIVMLVTGFYMLRFFAAAGDRGVAARMDRRAIGLLIPVLGWSLFWLVLMQDIPMLAPTMGWPLKRVSQFVVIVTLANLLSDPLLNLWKLSAASGDPSVGFVRSMRLTVGRYWWSLALGLMVMLPLMIAHYALAFAAIGRSPFALWSVLIADALLVGVMGPVMVASSFVAARRVAADRGLVLRPVGGAAV